MFKCSECHKGAGSTSERAENISKLVKSGGTVYITVYEGKGNNAEGPTKSGYQLNRKTADYLEEIQQVFPDAKRKGKLIECVNSGAITSSIYDEMIIFTAAQRLI